MAVDDIALQGTPFPCSPANRYMHFTALEECTNIVISPDEEPRILLTSKERESDSMTTNVAPLCVMTELEHTRRDPVVATPVWEGKRSFHQKRGTPVQDDIAMEGRHQSWLAVFHTTCSSRGEDALT